MMLGEEDSDALNSEEESQGRLRENLLDVKPSFDASHLDAQKELKALWKTVNPATTLTKCLNSRARIMASSNSPSSFLGMEGPGTELNAAFIPNFLFDSVDDALCSSSNPHASTNQQEEAYAGELLKSVQVVSDAIDDLVERVVAAESEFTTEKEKVRLGQEEIRRQSLLLEDMSLKLKEMEQFALGTNRVLDEMRQKVEDLVEETYRQSQRAAENDLELRRVKQDFESLKSYASWLLNIREAYLSSEQQFQTIEKLFERLMSRATQLEGEKLQKEADVQKQMQENVKLAALLDKKEAQLLAMNEQCKAMALTAANI